MVGTGSSRKSATNSVLWFTGEDIPVRPGTSAWRRLPGLQDCPIFFNTMEDAGRCRSKSTPARWTWATRSNSRSTPPGKVTATKNGEVIAESQLKTLVILDEVRAGGRIPLIIGRGLTTKAREALGLPAVDPVPPAAESGRPGKGYSLAQKMVGRACGLPEGRASCPAPTASRR